MEWGFLSGEGFIRQMTVEPLAVSFRLFASNSVQTVKRFRNYMKQHEKKSFHSSLFTIHFLDKHN